MVAIKKKKKAGAPKGNKNAVGNSGLKPKYDYAAEFRDLDEWSKKPDAIAISQFLFNKEYTYDYFLEMSKIDIEYSRTYRKAKERISKNREDLLHAGELNEKCWNRYEGYYSTWMRNHEREIKIEDANIEAEANAKAIAQNSPNEALLDLEKKMNQERVEKIEMQKRIKELELQLERQASDQLRRSEQSVQHMDRRSFFGQDIHIDQEIN